MTKKSVAIYNPYLESKGGGEKVCLAMAEVLSNDYDVTLIGRKKIDLHEMGEYFNLDLSKCSFYKLPQPSSLAAKFTRHIKLPGRLKNLIHEREDYKRLKSKKYDIFVNNCYKSAMPCPAKKGIYMCMFPQEFLDKSGFGLPKKIYHTAMDLLEKYLYGKTGLAIIDTYSEVTVNSSYTLSWMQKLWHTKEADILYPICDNMYQKGIKKEKIILNVGRFFADSGENHYKCQDKLLAAFKELTDLHEAGWQLHFVGSVAEDIDSLKYVLSLIRGARNYPVYFHLDTPFSELKELYNRASIYWHATGLGSDPDEHPEKQEHFGISTVEAMSAGCIPVVINTAGQKESVTDDVDGYLWGGVEELIEDTRKAASMSPAALKSMRQKSSDAAKKFNKQAFDKSVATLFDRING